MSHRLCARSAILVLLIGATALTIPSAVWAGNVATAVHDEAKQEPTGKFIDTLGNRAIGILAEKNNTADARQAKFRELLTDSFDMRTLGRFVIGRSWNAATPDQQKEYMNLFEALVVKTYGDKLTLYSGEGFRVVNVRPESEKDTIVNSQITHPDGSSPTSVDWRVRTKDGKMGVIDVMVEGVSLSVTQRQEYASIIQRDDGKIDGLLALMRDQVKESPDTTTASKKKG